MPATSKLFINTQYRSSHQRCSIKKGVLENFAKFTGLRPATGLQKDSGTGVFL